MSESSAKFKVKRILVALDASPQSLAALDAAVQLASKIEAELAGLFVEDIELLRMAESPSAREVAYPPSAGAPLNRGVMERRFRAQSEAMRNVVMEAAHRAHLRWSFRTTRGKVTAALLAAANHSDILAAGKLGWSVGRHAGVGSTAFGLACSPAPLLLISEGSLLGINSLLVHYDASPGSEAALSLAAELAGPDVQKITVLISTDQYDQSVAEVQARLKAHAAQLRVRPLNLTEKNSLSRVLKEEGAKLILAGRHLMRELDCLEDLLRSEATLLLLDNGFRSEF